MNLIRDSIERPIAVIAAVLMIVLFGLVALRTIPIQLAPDVNRPVITISTSWFGAAPAEVEREIINRQEEALAGLEGLVSITGRAEQGRAQITLEFRVDANMDRALLLVANRLDRVSDYPDEVDQPTLATAGSEDNAIAWFVITARDATARPIHEYGDFVNDIIKDRIERAPGVGRVNVFGASEREIHIVANPQRLASHQLTVGQVVGALRDSNISLGAGDIDEGKRRYVVRTEGELNNLEVIRAVQLRGAGAQRGRVTLGDVAEVRFGYQEPGATIRYLGRASMALNAERQTGANVIEVMREIRAAVDDLNRAAVPNAGLKLTQVYDETVYIDSAIKLVQQNIWIGGALAALLLLLFLRSMRATLIISLAIPVSVVGAFVAMAALGRSINVISLAGLAFAVGMVVDAAIVVLENIYRHREAGHSRAQAAQLGAQQVWGAVLVSALTTVMVFIPILIMQLEAGQLFRDIAVAISVAVMLSLLVSITVIPALSRRLLAEGKPRAPGELPGIDRNARRFVGAIDAFTAAVVHNRRFALRIVVSVTLTALLAAWLLLPKLEYLPEGNRNLLFGIIIPPPGYNLATTTKIAKGIENETKHLWVGQDDAAQDDSTQDDATQTGDDSVDSVDAGDVNHDNQSAEHSDAPRISRFFYVATRARTFLGAVAEDSRRVGELKPILAKPVFREPGTFGFITQPSIFGRGIGGGRAIELDISGADFPAILQTAGRAFGKIIAVLPREQGNEWRPLPGLELGAPEVRVIPDRLRLSDGGVSVLELARTLDAFNDGLRAAQSTVDGKLIDIIIKGEADAVQTTQGIGGLPIVTADGRIIPAAALADIVLTAGPTEIRHRERFRTITLSVRPAQTIALESAIELIQERVVAPLETEGMPPGIKLRIAGTADQLTETSRALAVSMGLALVIVFLVMAVLFESFVYPLIIMLSVPVAAAGGFGGLAALNLFSYQPLDMLTMLGFVILIGIVVNNAILLVHQTLHYIRRENLPGVEAIQRATRNRIRPIFMSTLTSVFGMLPLVLFPGAGSELYRGLGSVVVGGLSLSALLTLLIVPPMMALLIAPLEARRARSGATAESTSTSNH